MQIRHNLVVPEKPFFRRGRCVQKAARHLVETKHPGFPDEMVADDGLTRAAERPRRTLRPQTNSAMRNNRAVMTGNVRAALACDVALAVAVPQD